jgi:hypothetical protein
LRAYSTKLVDLARMKIKPLKGTIRHLPETQAFFQLFNELHSKDFSSEALSFDGRNNNAVTFYKNNFALIELIEKVSMIPDKLCSMQARLDCEHEEGIERAKIIGESAQIRDVKRDYNAYNSRVLSFFNQNKKNLAVVESEWFDSRLQLEREKNIASSTIDRLFRKEIPRPSSDPKVKKGDTSGSGTPTSVPSESSYRSRSGVVAHQAEVDAQRLYSLSMEIIKKIQDIRYCSFTKEETINSGITQGDILNILSHFRNTCGLDVTQAENKGGTSHVGFIIKATRKDNGETIPIRYQCTPNTKKDYELDFQNGRQFQWVLSQLGIFDVIDEVAAHKLATKQSRPST